MVRLVAFLCASAVAACAAQSGAIAYGKYLVEEVAQCQECHTPRTKSGELDKSKWLKGATLDFQPTQQTGEWSNFAPDLTSSGELFARWREGGLVRYLETGAGPSGHASRPPMPAYKLRPHDAEAIVAYLKSLK